uniref:cytochrome c3 family protein n=2 Tax=Bradyrhizobium TaxID=374 RepID=UPI002915F6E3
TARCDSCHNGSFTGQGTKGALGTASYPNHVATGGADCVSCHSKAASGFTSWGGAAFKHAATDTNCATCHNGKTAQGMTTPPHIPTGTLQCSNCHTNTAASFTTYTMNHAAVATARCDSCHNGSFTGQGTKGAMATASFPGHVATGGADCVSCHAKAASGGFTSWGGGAFAHRATDTNCAACHNGKTAMGMTTPPHIPTGTLQCSNCHTNTAASFTTYTMNHAAVATARCDGCHNGSYTGQGTKGALGTASFPNHVATGGADCVSCHAKAASGFTSWGGAAFKHATTDTNCAACHNGKTAQGMTTPPHIPTGTLQCSNCHSNTAASFTTYTMNHAAVATARCDSCHNGSFTGQGTKGAMGTASFPGHVATGGADCVSCHSKAASGGFTSWGGAAFTHSAANTNCSTCHNGSSAKGLTTPPHIPVTGVQCSNCHSNTAASFATYTMSHAAVHATRCDSCHNGSYRSQGRRGAQGPDHSAKTQDCGCCHVRAAANFSSWDDDPQKPAAGCSTTARSVVQAQAPVAKAVTPASTANRTMTAATIPDAAPGASAAPAASQAAAATKPAASSSSTLLFSSKPLANTAATSTAATTGSEAGSSAAAPGLSRSESSAKPGGVVAAVPQPPSSLPQTTSAPTASVPNDLRSKLAPPIGAAGTDSPEAKNAGRLPSLLPTFSPRAGLAGPSAPEPGARFNHMTAQGPCASCHNGMNAPGKPPKHLATNAPCETCHKSTTTFSGARFSHAGTTAACASCHNGMTASGKPPKHVATSAPCETCHKSTTTFSGARFSHTGTSAACASCHNGMAAGGKPQKHVATNAPCETCHKSTTTFSGARFSHTGTMAACATCHNGSSASGKPPRHVVTSAPCESCHKNTVSFSGARMDHASLTAPCASCHNGSNATGKSQKHFVTNVPCESCHRTISWSSVNYRHMSASYPNHSAAIGCTACHSGNSQAVPFKFAAYRPDCAACHANDFRPQQHAKLLKPAPMNYTVAELKDCTGACHIYADKSQTAIVTRRQRQHRVNGGGW